MTSNIMITFKTMLNSIDDVGIPVLFLSFWKCHLYFSIYYVYYWFVVNILHHVKQVAFYSYYT